MDITQVLVNWKNENDTRLDQLKVDNPNLYNAIGGALSFLSKKYGGEHVMLKPEVVQAELPQEQLLESNRVQLPTSQTFPIGLKDFDKAILLTMDELASLPYITLDDIYKNVKGVAFKYFKIITQTSFDETELGRRLENMAGTYIKKLNYDLYILTSSGQEVVDLLKTQLKTTPKVEEIKSFTQEDMDMNILKNIALTRNKLGKDPSAFTIWKDFDGLMFVDYDIKDTGNGNRNFMDDLGRLVSLNLVERIEDPNDPNIYRYKVSDEGFVKLRDFLENSGQYEEFANQIIKFNNTTPQVEELTPSDEDLKLEILLRMTDYYDGGVYQLLSQDDIIKYAVKHTFSIPSNKYFGLVVKLLGDGFVEKDPSRNTDSIRLTNKGYDKAMGWFEENLPEEEIATPPSTQLTDLQISILEGVKEASETKVGDGFVTINEIWPYNRGVKPNYYSVFATAGQSTPSLEKDLELLYAQGYLEFLFAGIGVKDYTYRLSQKGIDFLDDLKSQATPTTQIQPEPEIPEVVVGDDDEIDFDELENMLDDDSLDFNISDEDLENLEF